MRTEPAMTQSWSTIPQMVFAQARKYGHRIVFQVKSEGRYHPITWNEFASQVEGVALGLLELGIEPGQRVAILSENRPSWAIADVAILAIGAATVPIYTTLASSEIEYILRNSGARLLFVSNPELMAKVLGLEGLSDLQIVLFDAPYRVTGPRVFWLGELVGMGKAAGESKQDLLKKRIAQGRPEDLATIIYTSGTTGSPKGVMLTHGNFLSNAQAVSEALPIFETDTTLSFLPLSHVFERMAGYYFVLQVGSRIAYAESLEKVPENLLEIQPTIVTGVPRFYEKFYERVQESLHKARPLKRTIAQWALRVGRARAQRLLSKERLSLSLRARHFIADQLVFSKLRSRLGGRIRFFVSGGAPLSKELAEFFYSAGILILEGYGLTETSPVITVNRPGQFRFGTVGLPLSGVEVKIAADSEILTRGPHVMRGYWENPSATAEAIDAEGWFHTGDIGAIDADGFLTITDRKKDLIKTSGGKMIAPQNLENALKQDPLISDCVVIGDKRKFVAALIVPDFEKLEGLGRELGIVSAAREELVKHPKMKGLLWERVEAANKNLAPFEQIKKIAVLPEPFSLGGGELTPTLKVKRRVVMERYGSAIEAMYQE
jgi:long-chain acyl-CoA synthetase